MEQILKSEIIVQLYQSKEIGEFIDGFKKSCVFFRQRTAVRLLPQKEWQKVLMKYTKSCQNRYRSIGDKSEHVSFPLLKVVM